MISKNSVKSTALEERVSLAKDGPGPWLAQLVTRYSLLFLSVLLVIVFSLCTDSFASMLTLQAILASKSKIALLALAATVTMIVGKMDLNVGFGVVLWLITENTPVGRCMYAVGGNPVAAGLNGIRVNKYIILSFMASSVLTGFVGILVAAEQGVGQASVGMDFMLPALVGAFLGSTTIRPGRVNVWGTIVGIAVLAIGISGIQQFGGAFWVEPLFNGATLLLSITLAGYAQRRRIAGLKAVHRSAHRSGALIPGSDGTGG